MESLDKETFSFWITHPEELIPTDFQQLKEAIGQYPYCQPLYTLTAKAASIHQKSHAIGYVRQAAAYALSRNALRKQIENEFQWSDNLLSRLNELPMKIPDDYLKESYAVFKQKAEQNRSLPGLTFLDFAKPDGADAAGRDTPTAEKTAVPSPESQETAQPETVESPPLDDSLLTEKTIQTELEQQTQRLAPEAGTPGETGPMSEAEAPAQPSVRQQELSIIDAFIKKEPQISRVRLDANDPPKQEDLANRSVGSGNGLATESFAKILIKQGKIDRAIDIYQKLMVKNPEKKLYFADKIAELKTQQAQ